MRILLIAFLNMVLYISVNAQVIKISQSKIKLNDKILSNTSTSFDVTLALGKPDFKKTEVYTRLKYFTKGLEFVFDSTTDKLICFSILYDPKLNNEEGWHPFYGEFTLSSLSINEDTPTESILKVPKIIILNKTYGLDIKLGQAVINFANSNKESKIGWVTIWLNQHSSLI